MCAAAATDFICEPAASKRRDGAGSQARGDLKVLDKCAPMKSSPRVNVGCFALASCSALVSEIDVVRRRASLAYSSLTSEGALLRGIFGRAHLRIASPALR